MGLPLEGTGQWDIYKPLLANPALAPTRADIESASAVFREFLQIRKSSRLFRLETAGQIESVVSFYNNGPEQIPGLIVMRLTDTENIDSIHEEIVVLFNARPEPVTFNDPTFAGKNYTLNTIQQESSDPLVRDSTYDPADGTFTIPARTTAVFNILHEIIPEPTTIATQEAPAASNSNVLLTLAGVIGAFTALAALMLALRKRENK